MKINQDINIIKESASSDTSQFLSTLSNVRWEGGSTAKGASE